MRRDARVQDRRLDPVDDGSEPAGVALLSDEEIDLLLNAGEPPAPRDSEESRSLSIGACRTCQQPLSWPAPMAGYPAERRPCPGCGRWHFVLDRAAERDSQGPERERLVDQACVHDFARRQGGEVAQLIVRLVGVTVTHGLSGFGVERYVCSMPAVGVPLDPSGRPAGDAIRLTLCDLSSGGAGFLAYQVVKAPAMLVDFSRPGEPSLQLLGRLRWRQCAGNYSRFGCEFLNLATCSLPVV